MNFQTHENDYQPPIPPMVAYYNGGALGYEFCCISGSTENTDNEAIETAKREYGFDWMKPVFVEQPADWPENPKMSADGKRMLWLLVKA